MYLRVLIETSTLYSFLDVVIEEPQGGDTPAKPRAQALGYMLSYIYLAPSGAALPAQVLGGSGGGVKNKGGCIIV